jgi:hypothetical protein
MYGDPSNDLIVGAWRNGLEGSTAEFVAEVEDRRGKGFRQLYMESAVANLCDLLDSYDSVAQELLEAGQ